MFPTSHPEIRTDELKALTNTSLVVKIISEIIQINSDLISTKSDFVFTNSMSRKFHLDLRL